MIVFEPVQAAIWHCINHFAYNDAIFLAERLYAEVPSEEALYLLATCYYRAGQAGMAHSVLSRNKTTSPKGRYLQAKCCVDLLRIPEAERILKGDTFLRTKDIKLEEVLAEFGETSCFVLQLLGICASKTRRSEIAVTCFEKSLQLNPFLWDSYEQICNLGGTQRPEEVFSLSKIDNFKCCHGVNPVVNLVNQEYNSNATVNNVEPPFKKTPAPTPAPTNATCAVRLFVTPEESVPMTPNSLGIANLSTLSSLKTKKTRIRSMLSPLQLPTFGLLPFNRDATTPTDTIPMITPEMIHRPTRRVLLKDTPLQQTVFSQSGNTDNASPPRTSVRRSTRLFSSSASVKENNKSPKHSKFANPKSPSRKSKRGAAAKSIQNYDVVVNNEKNKPLTLHFPAENITDQALQIQKDSAEGLMSLFRDIGEAILLLSKFECLQAIQKLSSLPSSHYNTGWVQGILGKAYFELPDYNKSAYHFRKMREIDPERVAFTELMSTSLWFLQKEVELSALSQHLVTHARHSPQTWCAAANCFSLHKEHETAIKFLHRAVQMDPWFGYAYTLLGHEYLLAEELEKATTCFRNAIRISSRDYSAYFGLGSVYTKQEHFEQAQQHFLMAEKINPKNVVVLCHIGVVLNAQKKPEAALTWFEKAISFDPRNPLCKFQKANVFFNMGRNIEALAELEELRHIVPKESSVFYLMGKIHKKLGDTDKALMHFSWAMDLDPKGVHTQIKESIDPTLPRAADAEQRTPEQEPAELEQAEQNESDASF